MAYTVKIALKVDFKRIIDGVTSANLAGKKVYGFVNGVNVTTVPGVLVDSAGLITMQGVPPLTTTTVMQVTLNASGNVTFRIGDDDAHINPNDLRTSEVTVGTSNIYSLALTAANAGQLKSYTSSNLYEVIDVVPAPDVSANDALNSIVGITNEMEYRIDTESVWTDYAVTPITPIMLAGVHYVEVRLKNGYGGVPSLSKIVNFTTNPIPAAPAVTADDINNKVIGIDNTMEYCVNGGSWVAQDSVDVNTVDLRGVTPVEVRVKSLDGNPVGLITTLNFTKADVPAPNVTADNENNVIVGINGGMEYNIDATGWVDQNVTPFTPLAGNHSVDVRLKATQYTNASPVTILTFTANSNPAAPNVSANDDGNLIVGLTSAMEYTIDGGSWIDGSVTPNLDGVHVVHVRLKAHDTTPVSNVTEIYFTFNPPAAPNVSANDVTNAIVGLTGLMEYRVNGGIWVDGSTSVDLSGNKTVEVRVKSVGQVPAGNIKSLSFTSSGENTGGNTVMADRTGSGGIDIELSELTGLEAIQVNDVVVLQFNDTVDVASFDAARIDENTGKSLSVTYLVKDGNGDLVPSREVAAFKTTAEWEAGATFNNADFDWKLKQTPANVALEAGYFTWEKTDKDNDTLVIAPPVGGWKKGVTIRIELDNAIVDDFGNTMENDKDEVIYARVVSESETFITAPTENTVYLPYVDGTPADMVIPVAGYTRDPNGTARVQNVVVKATATDGTVLTATIPGADTDVVDGTTVEGYTYSFTPNAVNGGDFAVEFKLPVVVAEQKYKWVISAKSTNAESVETAAVNTKIVYHECYDNRALVLAATVGGKDAIGGTVKFKANEAGAKSLSFTLQGDYLDNSVILVKNTYTDGVLNAIPAGAITTIVNSPAGIEKTEKVIVADVAQFTVGTDPSKDDAEYVIVLQATTKAGSVVNFPITVKIDTIGLKVKKARKRPLV